MYPSRYFLQLMYLIQSQMTKCSAWQPIQRQHSKADAAESLHTAADGGKHAPHLSVPPLMNNRLDERASSLPAQNAQLRRSCFPIIQKNPPSKIRELVLCDGSCYLCMVYLVDLKARMKEPLCHSTIVCNNQKSLGIRIESTDRIETYRKMRQEIQYCSASPIIVCRRETAAWFMEKNIQLLLTPLNRCTIDGDLMERWIILAAKHRDGHAVHRNAAISYQCLCCTAGSYPGMAENFLQSFFHTVSTALSRPVLPSM